MDEVFNENTEPVKKTRVNFPTVSDNDEVALESYSQAVLEPERRKSMMSEIKALRNSECWRVVQHRKDISYAVGVLWLVLRGYPS